MRRTSLCITGRCGFSPVSLLARRGVGPVFPLSIANRSPNEQGMPPPDTRMTIRSADPILAPRDTVLSLVRP